jgi:5-methylcytosine-specific restriction endonuclease McrA
MGRACWHNIERVKCCTRCSQEKPLHEFYACRYTTNQGKQSIRYESRCRKCVSKRGKERRAKDPSLSSRYMAEWRSKNGDRELEYRKQYQDSDHGKRVRAKNQRLRKARMRSGSGDDAEIRAIYTEAMEIERIIAVCPVFDIPELTKKMHVDHIIPLARGGKHVASNLQILPGGINVRKHASCPR